MANGGGIYLNDTKLVSGSGVPQRTDLLYLMTELSYCGLQSVVPGPAIANRFTEYFNEAKPQEKDPAFSQLVQHLLNPSGRNVKIEKALLTLVSQKADEQIPFAVDFIIQIGKDLVRAINVLLTYFDPNFEMEKIVLTGGIGEHFGFSKTNGHPDLLLKTIQSDLIHKGILIKRSNIGLEAELVGLINS